VYVVDVITHHLNCGNAVTTVPTHMAPSTGLVAYCNMMAYNIHILHAVAWEAFDMKIKVRQLQCPSDELRLVASKLLERSVQWSIWALIR
jgi:hypothetical protein